MDPDRRDRLAIVIATAALIAGLGTVMFGRYDSGIRLATDDAGRLVVGHMNEYSKARMDGIEPGMLVIRADQTAVIRLPEYVYPSVEPTPDPDTGEVINEPIGVDPLEPTFLRLSPETLGRLTSRPFTELQAIQPLDLDTGSVSSVYSRRA